MLAKGRVKVCGAVLVAALASIWAPGCATRGQSVAAAGSVSAPADGSDARAAASPVVITGASLLTEGESPRLLLTAERPLSPSIFSGDDGKKVVVDLANAVVSPGMEPPRADGSVVSGLGMKAFTELGVPHVQFELHASRAIESTVATENGSNAVAVVLARATTPAPIREAPVETAGDIALASAPVAPAAEASPAPVVVAASTAALAPEPPTVVLAKHSAGGRPASRLASFRAQRSGDSEVVVELAGDGEFGYEAFRLADPPRYVLDLTGVKNASHKKQQDVGAGSVSRVRVSQFRAEPAPVTRVVVDLTADDEPALAQTKNGLVLRFGAARKPVALTAALSPRASSAREVPAPVVDVPAAPVAEASVPPAATSYEKHETEDPAETVVGPATTVASSRGDFSEPAPGVHEDAPAPQPAPVLATPAPPAPVEAAPVQAPETRVAEAPKPAPDPPAADSKPVAAVKAEPKKPAKREPAAVVAQAPQPAQAAPPSVVAPPAPVPPPPAKGAKSADTKRKPSADDRALLEAAEALLEQQQDRPRDVGGIYESRTVGVGDKVYTGEPITLNLKDADIKDTLQKFSELTGLNIVLDPDVRGTVTVSLTDIPWDQALELILKINGLGYVLEGNVMRISSLPRLTQEETNRLALIRAQDQNRPVRTVIQRLSYAGPAETAEIVRKVMSPRGDIILDPRNQSLIIRELPDYLPTVLDLIKSIDQPTPQVMIEARIVEATRTFSRNLGIDWNFHAVADQVHGNTTGLIFPNNVNVTGGLNGILSNGNNLLKLALGNVLDTFNLDASLSAAEARGLVKVISSPKVQTQNNQRASIQSGFQIPVQTTVNNTTSVLYVNATLSLDVAPQITAEGTVIMDINVQDRQPAPGVSIAGANNVPLLTRDAKTRLMVRDGGTAVIGGIFKLTANEAQNM
ncbi:MAG TPA: type IV pilus secretin PilQ, partial [Thermoanaerobaculia bacterium]|nr:type IV pilus secretin PilQ [Thermoanaerobaculia bacterium]